MEKSISSDLIRGHIDTIILYTLLDGDKHAQLISESIEKKSENKYQINQATLYSSLKRLENLKLVTAYWHDSEAGRRRFFKLTDAGKNTVNSNLSDWSYSRAIIDKLMDCEPAPIVKTTVVERIVEKPVEVIKTIEKVDNSGDISRADGNNVATNNTAYEQSVGSKIRENYKELLNKELKKSDTSLKEDDEKTAQTENVVSAQKTEQKDEQKYFSADKNEVIYNSESQNDINFRNILNGLIKSTEKKYDLTKTENQADERNCDVDTEISAETVSEPTVKKFNETITDIAPITASDMECNKIDFSDLADKVAGYGYKLKVSTKNRKVKLGDIYKNKVNMVSALSIFLIALIEFLGIVLFADYVTFGTVSIVVPIVIMVLFPAIMVGVYAKKPEKTCDKIKPDSILVGGIIFFDLFLFNVIINLLIGTSFSIPSELLINFIIPTIVSADVFIYFLIRYLISTLKTFSSHRKKA